MHRRVGAALEQSRLAPGMTLIVAVSGGPDSLALLHSICHLGDAIGLRLHGAHLDHGLRGDSSKSDARFVAEVFRGLGMPYTVEEADVNAFRRQHSISLEAAARKVRYDFLAKVAANNHTDVIALGHTAGDQAETVLMHIIRGSGLTGLRGMRTVTSLSFDGKPVRLVRPLLQVSRAETLEYCRARGLKPRQDESNLSPDLDRNRIRLELVPLLEQYNPAIRDALVRLSDSAAQEIGYLKSETDRVWHETARIDESSVTLGRDSFTRLPPALQSHLLRRAMMEVKGDIEDLRHSHIQDMARLMRGPAGRTLDLPGNIRLSISYESATLAPSDRDRYSLPPLKGEHELKVPGETLLAGWRVIASFSDTGQGLDERLRIDEPGFGIGSAEIENSNLQDCPAQAFPPAVTACLDYSALGGPLRVRPRRPGDRFQPLGMSQAKKLQDFMVDSKVPRLWRDRVPLLTSPRGIAWVVGWRIADWAKVIDERAWLLKLRFTPES